MNTHEWCTPLRPASAPAHPQTYTHKRILTNGVPPSAQHQHRQSERLDELDALPVPPQREIEAPETITRQTIRAALKHNGPRAVPAVRY